MLEVLTGTGLAASAGLNAYIPLLTLGLLARYSDVVDLPGSWQWLGNGWVLGILAVLLAVEVVADKVPVVDHVNDVVQTVVRPTAGGLVFGAGSASETVTVSDPDSFFSSTGQWAPVIVGVLIALGVHLLKSAARPVVNASTGGVGAPVASTAEDAASVLMSLVAIVLPVLVLAFLVVLPFFLGWFFRRRAQRRRERRAAREAGFRV
ncbi:DUF4126 domain-containing protein [Micromonospora nigra]|nr:DUF4126 domain-containing protein [Micromonospora nigra]